MSSVADAKLHHRIVERRINRHQRRDGYPFDQKIGEDLERSAPFGNKASYFLFSPKSVEVVPAWFE